MGSVEEGAVKRAKEKQFEEDDAFENIVPPNVENSRGPCPFDGTMVGGRLMRHRGDNYSPPKSHKKEPRPKRLPRWMTAWGRVENGINILNVAFPVEGGKHVGDEGTALFDSRLTAMTEDIAGEVEEVPVHKLTEYTVFDRNGSLAPLDAGLLEKDHELFICGCIKPIFDETNTCDGGPFCSRIGPITEWGISGYDGGERAIVQLATVYAEYELLGTPSAEYAPFMISLREKAMLSKVVIDQLQANYDCSYEDMLMVIAEKRPEGLESEPLSEETVLRHASYLLDQVWSYDQAGEDEDAVAQVICDGGVGTGTSEGGESVPTGGNQDDYKLFFSPMIQYLAKLEGYTFSDRRRVRRMGGPQRGVRKDIHRGMPATTTPLVSWVFEDFFSHQVEGVKRIQDDSWMPFLIGFDGLEVECKGPHKILRGLLRFREGDQVPTIQLKDDNLSEGDENDSSEEDMASKYISLGKFERLAECPTKKPRESIKFVDTGLSLSKIAQEAGWSCVTASGTAPLLAAAEEDGDNEEYDDIVGLKKPIASKANGHNMANKHATRPGSVNSMKSIKCDDPPIDWVGNGQISCTTTNKKSAKVEYYNKVKIDEKELELGGFCMARGEDGEECLFRILNMWEQEQQSFEKSPKSKPDTKSRLENKKNNNKLYASNRVCMFIGHKYCFGIDTVLGTAADGREVFMLDDVDVLPLSSVSCPCVCRTRSVPRNWSGLGGGNIEEYLQEISNLFNNECEAGKSEFFVQKLYSMDSGRFVDLPIPRDLLPKTLYDGTMSLSVNDSSSLDFDVDAFATDMISANANHEVAISIIAASVLDMIQYGNLPLPRAHSLLTNTNALLESLRDTRTLGEPERCLSSKHSSLVTYNAAQVCGQKFKVGDCVYLQSETFNFSCNPVDEEPGWMKELEERRKDKVRYPELYRLKEGRRFKGSHDGNVPFDIGQVLSIRKTSDGAVKLKVRLFYRPENTHWGGSDFGATQHPHRLYWSYEEQSVDIDVVLGVCNVLRYTEEQITSMSEDDTGGTPWNIWEGSTKHKDTFFFSNCYDTRSKSTPKLTSLPDEAHNTDKNCPMSVSASTTSKARGNGCDDDFDNDNSEVTLTLSLSYFTAIDKFSATSFNIQVLLPKDADDHPSGMIKINMTQIMDSLKKFPTSIRSERGKGLKDCHEMKGSNTKGKGKAHVSLSDNHEGVNNTSAKVRIKKPEEDIYILRFHVVSIFTLFIFTGDANRVRILLCMMTCYFVHV